MEFTEQENNLDWWEKGEFSKESPPQPPEDHLDWLRDVLDKPLKKDETPADEEPDYADLRDYTWLRYER